MASKTEPIPSAFELLLSFFKRFTLGIRLCPSAQNWARPRPFRVARHDNARGRSSSNTPEDVDGFLQCESVFLKGTPFCGAKSGKPKGTHPSCGVGLLKRDALIYGYIHFFAEFSSSLLPTTESLPSNIESREHPSSNAKQEGELNTRICS